MDRSKGPLRPPDKPSLLLRIIRDKLLSLLMGYSYQMALLQDRIAALQGAQAVAATMAFGVFLLRHENNRERLIMKYRSVDKDILLAIILTIITMVLACLVPSNWDAIRVLALPLVLVLPGYALTSALFARRSLGIMERIVFSLGLSLTIVIVGGFALNFTPFGLRTNSWAVFLGVITLIASAIALVRRQRRTGTAQEAFGIGSISFTFGQGLLLGLAMLIICGAVVVSIIGAERQPRPGFTQLWILPGSGAANAKNVVRIGMSNMESQATEYRLTVDMDGKAVKVWSSILLGPDQNWEATLVLPQTGHTGTSQVEALLYRMDAPTTLYRHVVLWVNT
jgi:uncharacterized membrane protein